MVWEMSFEEFQNGHYGGHLGYRNGAILAILNLYATEMIPIKIRLNPTYGFGGDFLWRISRWPPWQPPWYRNGTILAILNLYVARMPPLKFRLNPTYDLGDVICRISRWLPRRPSWISGQNNFSNSESLCSSDASHQVSAQSDFWFGRRCRLRNSMAAMVAILDIRMDRL